MEILKTLLIALMIAAVSTVAGFGFNTEAATMTDNNQNFEKATFAGGCFWCVESDLEKVDGVIEVLSGYTGGHKKNPTYKEVSAGITGHVEAVEVLYDPAKVTYETLLDVFWRHVDPTDPGGQFVDRGSQYRTAIFYHNEEQKGWPKNPRPGLTSPANSTAPWSPKSCRPGNSMWPKSTTRTITKRARFDTNSTGSIPEGISFWIRCGAKNK